MTEQIVDLMEANMPGPRGATDPQGPQGLPGVDAVPADEAVAAYVLGDSATQQALAGLKGRWGSHVPFFGDSITAGYLSGGVTFRDVLSSTFGFEDHNYAAGGEGFYRAGQSGGDIAHEVANSKSDDSYDHSRVRLAVVCGGVNDVDRDVTKGRDGVRRVMEAIRGEYPNATILLASGLGGAFNPTYGRLDHRNVGYYDAIVSEGMARGAMIAPDAFTWVGTDDTLLADGLHPNASGHRVIGAHLSNILAGLADPTAVTDASGQITKTADQDTLDAKLHVAGRSVRLYLHLWHILTDAELARAPRIPDRSRPRLRRRIQHAEPALLVDRQRLRQHGHPPSQRSKTDGDRDETRHLHLRGHGARLTAARNTRLTTNQDDGRARPVTRSPDTCPTGTVSERHSTASGRANHHVRTGPTAKSEHGVREEGGVTVRPMRDATGESTGDPRRRRPGRTVSPTRCRST